MSNEANTNCSSTLTISGNEFNESLSLKREYIDSHNSIRNSFSPLREEKKSNCLNEIKTITYKTEIASNCKSTEALLKESYFF